MSKKNKAARAAFAAIGRQKYMEKGPTTYQKQMGKNRDANYGITTPTGNDRQFITLMSILGDGMEKTMGRSLEARLRTIPNGWRRYRTVTGMLRSVCDDLFCTLPSSALGYIKSMYDYGGISISYNGSGNTDGLMMPVRTKDLLKLGRFAQESECAMCVRDGDEIRRCPLRKTLDDCGFLGKNHGVGCWYRNNDIERI